MLLVSIDARNKRLKSPLPLSIPLFIQSIFILIIFDHRSMIMKFSKHKELVQHCETWHMLWITLPYTFLIRQQLGCPSA